MKTAAVLLAIILVLLSAGCTAPAAPAVSQSPGGLAGIPGLTGTWTGPMEGYDEGTGFSDYPDFAVSMTVSEQHGRIFAGNFSFRSNGTETLSGFAGAIGRDNRTLTIAEENGGYCTGTMVGADEMESGVHGGWIALQHCDRSVPAGFGTLNSLPFFSRWHNLRYRTFYSGRDRVFLLSLLNDHRWRPVPECPALTAFPLSPDYPADFDPASNHLRPRGSLVPMDYPSGLSSSSRNCFGLFRKSR